MSRPRPMESRVARRWFSGRGNALRPARAGMINVVRESHAAQDDVLVGFGSYQGSVIAADAREASMPRMDVPPAQDGR